jgi:transcriptional regulator with XRE-family HTH domain
MPPTSRYPHWMQNGIAMFRERAGLSKAELARRVGTTRAAHELLFPELARVDINRFRNVYEALDAEEAERAETPVFAVERDFLQRLLPSAANHRFQLMTVDSDPGGNLVQKGDTVFVDLDDTRPARAGIYAIVLNGVPQLRHLSPTASGKVRIGTGADSETVDPDQIQVLGRARLRLSTI